MVVNMINLNKLVSENKVTISYDAGRVKVIDCCNFEEILNVKIHKIIVGIEINSIPEDFLYIDKCLIMDENDTVIFNEQKFVDGKAYEKVTDIQAMLSVALKVNKDDIYIQE